MNKPMATKGTRPEVLFHISRHRALGERMIGDHDRPRMLDLVVTTVMVLAVLFSHALGWI